MLASLGSKVPFPDLPSAEAPEAGAAAPLEARAAAAVDAAPSLSAARGLMHSLSSLAPSSHVMRSSFSM